MRYCTVLSRAAWIVVAVAAAVGASAEEQITGIYRANGEGAELAHVTVLESEPWMDVPTVLLVLSEQDPGDGGQVELRAAFGELGSALVVGLTREGKVIQCEVAHASLEHMGASVLGVLHAEDVSFADGLIRARLTTNGAAELFDETWEVDLKIAAPLP